MTENGFKKRAALLNNAEKTRKRTIEELEKRVAELVEINGNLWQEIDGLHAFRRLYEALEQREQERTVELEESKQRYLDLTQLLPESVFEMDREGYITYGNRSAVESFGYATENTYGRLHIRDIVAQEDYERVAEKVAGILAGKGPDRGEFRVRRKDGSQFEALLKANSIEHQGAIIGLRGVATDLTESRRAEAERTALEQQLRQTQKMEALGTLAGGIAHDFNNMLAVIIGSAELALDDVQDEAPRRCLSQILHASQRSRDLVKQILTFSRKRSGQANPVEIVPLLTETGDLLRASLPTTVRMELKNRVKPNTMAVIEPSQFQQLIVNLVNNAAYAMRDTGGKLSIALSAAIAPDREFDEVLKPGRYVKLTVKDTGAGMTPEVQTRIYEPFFTTKGQSLGTGMGLAMVYGIVQSCGGAIKAESEVGKGSKFTVLLPRADGSAVPKAPLSEQAVICSRNESILFVDDEPAIVETAKAMLERIGCRITALTDASQALRVFMRNPRAFDLVITDQTMPKMTGIALAKRILAKRKEVPIILCTGYSETVSAEKAKEAGICEFIMKPIAKKEMEQAIRRALKQNGT